MDARTGTVAGRVAPIAVAALSALFLAGGALGLLRYARGYRLYRGFPPPADPGFVVHKGTELTIRVTSPALGGRTEPVLVYLPPGYSD